MAGRTHRIVDKSWNGESRLWSSGENAGLGVLMRKIASQAKRKGRAAYDAFLDNIGGASPGIAPTLQCHVLFIFNMCWLNSVGRNCRIVETSTSAASPGNAKSDDEIDSLLSELDMDLTSFGVAGSTGGGYTGNQKEAPDTELQDLLKSLFTKEGVGQAVSSKKSLQRSMTVGCPLLSLDTTVRGSLQD